MEREYLFRQNRRDENGFVKLQHIKDLVSESEFSMRALQESWGNECVVKLSDADKFGMQI